MYAGIQAWAICLAELAAAWTQSVNSFGVSDVGNCFKIIKTFAQLTDVFNGLKT